MNPRQHVSAFLRWTRSVSEQLLKDFPADKGTHQCSPTDNHAVWVVAHLAMTDHWIASTVGAAGTTKPEGWDALFGMGSKPTNEPAKYPSLAAVRKVFDAHRAVVLNWLESAPDAALAVSLKEKTGGFATDPIDACYKVGWHEGWHFGQVATIRKGLGLPNIM